MFSEIGNSILRLKKFNRIYTIDLKISKLYISNIKLCYVQSKRPN